MQSLATTSMWSGPCYPAYPAPNSDTDRLRIFSQKGNGEPRRWPLDSRYIASLHLEVDASGYWSTKSGRLPPRWAPSQTCPGDSVAAFSAGTSHCDISAANSSSLTHTFRHWFSSSTPRLDTRGSEEGEGFRSRWTVKTNPTLRDVWLGQANSLAWLSGLPKGPPFFLFWGRWVTWINSLHSLLPQLPGAGIIGGSHHTGLV